MDIHRDFARVTEKLKKAKNIAIPIQVRGSTAEIFCYGLVTKSLTYINQTRLNPSVLWYVRELLKQAERAVLFYHYIREKKTEISDVDIETASAFRQELKTGISRLRNMVKKPLIEFAIRLEERGVQLSITARTPINASDREIVVKSIGLGAKSDRPEDVPGFTGGTFPAAIDKGLLLASMAMHKARLPEESLQFSSSSERIVFAVSIARDLPAPDLHERIENNIISEIESIPSLPENIKKIMELCDSEKSDARGISREIEKDPSIAGQIIKLANSGGFAGGNISQLQEAVTIVGLNNISGLLLRVGAFSILENRYQVAEEMLNHHLRVAYYSRQIARRFKLASRADQAYTAGLLHDIGKILLLSTLANRRFFDSLTSDRDIMDRINMEEIEVGADHAVIGRLLAAKWNFPSELQAAIELHHTPHLAPADLQSLIYPVYLANAICNHQDKLIDFFSLEPDVLGFFNLNTESSFEMLSAAISSDFQAKG